MKLEVNIIFCRLRSKTGWICKLLWLTAYWPSSENAVPSRVVVSSFSITVNKRKIKCWWIFKLRINFISPFLEELCLNLLLIFVASVFLFVSLFDLSSVCLISSSDTDKSHTGLKSTILNPFQVNCSLKPPYPTTIEF